MKDDTSARRWLFAVLIAAAAAWAPASHAQSDAIDSEAVNLLRRSTDFVAGLKQFSADIDSAIEVVMSDGQKLQLDQRAVVTVARPNRMRADRVGDLVKQTFYYDGRTLTVNMPDYGYYATAAAPDSLDGMLDFARDRLGIIAPGADLIYTNAFERLSTGLTSAKVVGESAVRGARCDHLAFRNAEVDWQIWIEQGAKPLPRKLVITSKKMPQAPEFIAVINKWDLAPKVGDATFAFKPPKGAARIEFIPLGTAAK